MPFEFSRDGFLFSDDRDRLQIDVIHGFLKTAYWCTGISRARVMRAVDNSLCGGLYAADGTQVGFGRVITDRALFAYLMDVFILEPWRGRGLSRQLLNGLFDHPELQNLKRWMLISREAQSLYEKYGFERVPGSDRIMHRSDPEVFARLKAEGRD